MTKYSDLISSLKQGKILPLYLFFGEEEFLVQEAVALIINKVVDQGARDFNFNTLHCKDTSASEMVNLCQTLPFMSEKRLVIAQAIDAFKQADLEELIPYLNDPSPSTCLLMISNQGRFDKKSVISAVEAHGAVTRFFAILDNEVIAWIERWAKTRGLSIQRDAAQFLWQTLGNDLRKIVNELEKVLIFNQDKKTITFDEVKSVVGDFREYTSFDLAAALGSKNGEKAFLMLSRLIQEGEAPVGLLGAIAWNFRRLLQAKSLEATGIGIEESMKKLRPPVIFHQAASFRSQMKSYTLDELREVFAIMLSTDKALKSSGLKGSVVLERMIMRLCGEGRVKMKV
jgi:DNA polymerase-3 subunit delta